MNRPDDHQLTILVKYERAVEARLRRKRIPPSEVPDMRQETYRRVLKFLEQHEVTGAVKGLLETTADCVAADYWNARARSIPNSLVPLNDDVDSLDLETEYNEQEIRKHLREVLEGCDPLSREMALAFFADGQNLDSIANRFQTSRSTAHRVISQTVKDVATEFKRRRISRHAILPFTAPTLGNDTSSTTARSADAPALWNRIARPALDYTKFALASTTGAVIAATAITVTEPSASQVPWAASIAPVISTAFASRMPPTPVEPPTCPVCPDPQTISPLPPQTITAVYQPAVDAKSRDLMRTLISAAQRGDCDTVNRLRPQLTGSFATAAAKLPPCKPAN